MFPPVVLLVVAFLLSVNELAADPGADAAGFVGQGRCGNPRCHGAGLPADPATSPEWRPWKSARTQWLDRNVDRHSRAYATLTTKESARIAGFMGIEATKSDKCLVCHAPAASAVSGSSHRRSDGVTCEHCHGAAEHWLEPHVERDWKSKKKDFLARGFYDNNNFRRRATKCASCHVAIDHEIVAGGHPPLQFELVAYAQIMKHWDDQDEQPANAYSVDPTLWAIGQVTGLTGVADMIARRAGDQNYQALGKFPHFRDRNCYQCHHKLVADAVRQGQGHYEMTRATLGVTAPARAGELEALWRSVGDASARDAGETRTQAQALSRWLAPRIDELRESPIDRDATKRILSRVTAQGSDLKRVTRFSFSRPKTSNVVRVESVEVPWWWTTGAPEQTILAVQALCEPAFGAKCFSSGAGGIGDELDALLGAADRFDYRPDRFEKSLGALHRTLFP